MSIEEAVKVIEDAGSSVEHSSNGFLPYIINGGPCTSAYFVIELANYIINRPQESTNEPTAWDGEGFPPVGTVCMNKLHDEPITIIKFVNCPERGDGVAFSYIDGASKFLHVRQSHQSDDFEPMRSPEQIAIDELANILANIIEGESYERTNKGTAKLIINAGYRKYFAGP